ncbi:MAG: DUF2490 domain-containing protein [Bacteroidota bacterium]
MGIPLSGYSQIDESQPGAWYMYFWSTTFNDGPWGVQGDLQYRNWNIIGDLEQLLTRGGLTYTPDQANVKLTLGYANIQTGQFGDGVNLVSENRIYQEALIPQKVGKRFYLTHRFRYEQRFVEGQDFRTRFRYNLFINVPINKSDLKKGAIYIAVYNELFINGERNIGDGRRVELFDRNRTYGAVGYSISDQVRVQLGAMRQITNNWVKSQMQASVHHNF